MSPKIETHYIYPPIPIRQFDWCAYAAGDEESGRYGRGRTEQEAVTDLLDGYCRERTDLCTHRGECLICCAIQGEKCQATP